jgi:predicted lipid-binding transport protein (Tim44 family)
LNRELKQGMHSLARGLIDGARKVLTRAMLLLIGCLIGAVGLGFLIVWAFATLSAAIGVGMAALVIGLGLSLISGVLVSLALRQPKPVPAESPKEPPANPMPDLSDVPSQIAFTVAFVLARYLTGDNRD